MNVRMESIGDSLGTLATSFNKLMLAAGSAGVKNAMMTGGKMIAKDAAQRVQTQAKRHPRGMLAKSLTASAKGSYVDVGWKQSSL